MSEQNIYLGVPKPKNANEKRIFDAVEEVVVLWNSSLGGTRILIVGAGSLAHLHGQGRRVYRISPVSSGFFDRQWIGRCVAVNIYINESYYFTTKPQLWKFWRTTQADPRFVLAHEFGHAAGLSPHGRKNGHEPLLCLRWIPCEWRMGRVPARLAGGDCCRETLPILGDVL
jgi:hypothetical protein